MRSTMPRSASLNTENGYRGSDRNSPQSYLSWRHHVVFGVRAEGLLTMAATGQQVQYRGVMHCMFNKNQPFDQFASCNYRINF